MQVAAVDGGMASRTPAGALAQEQGVGNLSDKYFSCGTGRLSVAFQAQIGIALHQQLAIGRAVGVMTRGAAFAHRFMLKNKRTCLLAMTTGASLILPRHRETRAGFENVRTMRIVALDAIHFVLRHGMMLRQAEGRLDIQVTIETGGGILSGIGNKFSAATARLDVQAAWTVTRFAARFAF